MLYPAFHNVHVNTSKFPLVLVTREPGVLLKEAIYPYDYLLKILPTNAQKLFPVFMKILISPFNHLISTIYTNSLISEHRL